MLSEVCGGHGVVPHVHGRQPVLGQPHLPGHLHLGVRLRDLHLPPLVLPEQVECHGLYGRHREPLQRGRGQHVQPDLPEGLPHDQADAGLPSGHRGEGAVHDPRGAGQRAEGDVLRSDPPDDGPRGLGDRHGGVCPPRELGDRLHGLRAVRLRLRERRAGDADALHADRRRGRLEYPVGAAHRAPAGPGLLPHLGRRHHEPGGPEPHHGRRRRERLRGP
mmetsp:Transcript_68182/g.200215  ORF Transcript_68182/g.200215 Transcript_68182/m.200215 type:complete len:219 (+) Transcript_68182:495-1151(+)